MNYTKAYGKLRGGTLPELGGNFRLCAVDQKRPFFLTAGPFLDLLPRKDLSPLQGPLRADRLTGRPLTGRLLTGRPPYELQESLRGGAGTLPELGGNFRLCAVHPKKLFFRRVGSFLDPALSQTALRGSPLTGPRCGGETLVGTLNPKPKTQAVDSLPFGKRPKTNKPKGPRWENGLGFRV